MNKKRICQNLPYLFLIVCLLLFIGSMFANRAYFNRIAYDNVYLYQTKQALSLLLLFAVGYLFLKTIQHTLSELWIVLLAFPSAVCIFSFCGELLLLMNIAYYFYRVCILTALGLLLCYGVRRFLFRAPLKKITLPIGRVAAILCGTACLVSTGFTYVLYNYDSYFYFSDYGKALSLMMSYRDIVSDNSFVLTNIGQFLPIANSYMTFWGLDSSTPLLGFFILNILTVFGVTVYERVRPLFTRKKALLYTLAFVVMLITCSGFFMFTNWVLSNTYIMFYLFLLFLLGQTDQKPVGIDRALLIMMYALAVTMLRKEGLIVICFVFVCFSIKKLYSSVILTALFIPSAAYQLFYIYYLRHIIYAQTTLALGSSLLSNNFMKLLLLGVVGTIAYLLFLHIPAEKICKRYLPHILTAFFFAIFFYTLIGNLSRSIDYLDSWTRNLLGFGFGFCVLNILLLAVLIALMRPPYEYSLFFIVGYILVILTVYYHKGNTEVGIDNSGLRALYQIIPVFYYTAAAAAAKLFEDQKHES